tara:strand:+ start:1767 stop:1916 length:150 start_codon:yes stop_codon:yes gene_type:complete
MEEDVGISLDKTVATKQALIVNYTHKPLNTKVLKYVKKIKTCKLLDILL